MNNIEQVIIVGGGVAGLSASIYAARASLNPILLAGSSYGGQLMLTSEVENYPGFESILGPELIEKMREQAQKLGTKIVDENIISVDLKKSPFSLSTSKEKFLTKSVIISTGAKAVWLGLESEKKFIGKGVSACATCDGFFFKNKTVAVVGGGDSAMEEALVLTKFASKVYIIHRRNEFRASQIMQDRVKKNSKIEIIWNSEVVEVLGKEKVEGVKIKNSKHEAQNPKQIKNSNSHPRPALAKFDLDRESDPRIREDDNETVLPVEGLFVAIGHKPDTNLFKGQIELDLKGYIKTSAVKAIDNNKFLINLISNYSKKAPISNIKKINKLDIEIFLDQLDQLDQLKIRNFNYEYPTMTSVKGVFAAGDCVDYKYRQAGTAVGTGIQAALDVEKWLNNSA